MINFKKISRKPMGTGKALKLGSKSRDVESFVDQLKSEGQSVAPANVSSTINNKSVSGGGGSQHPENAERYFEKFKLKNNFKANHAMQSSYYFSVHLKIDESITLTAGRDGGLQNMEVHGTSVLRVQDEASCMIRIQFDNADTRGIQFQVCTL
jgi:hypothetical protein